MSVEGHDFPFRIEAGCVSDAVGETQGAFQAARCPRNSRLGIGGPTGDVPTSTRSASDSTADRVRQSYDRDRVARSGGIWYDLGAIPFWRTETIQHSTSNRMGP